MSKPKRNQSQEDHSQKPPANLPLEKNLQANVKFIQERLGYSVDLVIRQFRIGSKQQIEAALIYFDGLQEKVALRSDVLRALMIDARAVEPSEGITRANAFEFIKTCTLPIVELEDTDSREEVLDKIVRGSAIILINGTARAFIIGTKAWESREVTEPDTEATVRGPREGFTEKIRSNTALIRNRLKTASLRIDPLYIGRLTQTEVNIIYIDGVANSEVVREAKERLKRIDVDAILDSGYIEEFIEDHPFSPFPQINHSERPDKISACLLEGRIAIVVEGSPQVLIIPTVFFDFFQAVEDYYERYPIIALFRLIRVLSWTISLNLPAFYIAITTFHQEVLPTSLLISIAAAREGVPVPAFIEALAMQVVLEVLREAGLRLPRPVGQSISIVGGLVIGESAVRAGFVSSTMVIVIAVTAITSFAIPAFSSAITTRLLTFPMMLLAATMGFYGVFLGHMMILVELVSMRSFGVPYFTPFGPGSLRDFKDIFVRVPWWAMDRRPGYIQSPNPRRQKPGQRPKPSQGGPIDDFARNQRRIGFLLNRDGD